MYIKNNSKIVDKYQDEVEKLSNISKKVYQDLLQQIMIVFGNYR